MKLIIFILIVLIIAALLIRIILRSVRAYPNRVLFQTMTPQAKCSIAS